MVGSLDNVQKLTTTTQGLTKPLDSFGKRVGSLLGRFTTCFRQQGKSQLAPKRGDVVERVHRADVQPSNVAAAGRTSKARRDRLPVKCPVWAALQRAGKATLRRWRRHRLEVEAFGELESAMRRSWRPSCMLTPQKNLGRGLLGGVVHDTRGPSP
ncbi:uncharacterized protein [Dermacentor andersoni]|uniref:uncharacterized protein isoform X1 n=1 Tax=Dermacentor andersoni TaxID=34620 RepID=UPI003B3BE6F1